MMVFGMQAHDAYGAPDCPRCGNRPCLVGVMPRLGLYPELLTLRCAACDEVFTSPVEDERSALAEELAV